MKQLTQQQVQQLMMLHQQGQHDKVIQQASNLIQDYPKEFILFNLFSKSFIIIIYTYIYIITFFYTK